MKIAAVGLFVTDMVNSVRFYRDLLNTEAYSAGGRHVWDGGPFAEFFRDGYHLMMYRRDDFEKMISFKPDYPNRINGTMEIMLDYPGYADVDKGFERLTQMGAIPVMEPKNMPWGQRTCYITDPDGNLIEIGSFGKDDCNNNEYL